MDGFEQRGHPNEAEVKFHEVEAEAFSHEAEAGYFDLEAEAKTRGLTSLVITSINIFVYFQVDG